MNIGLYQSASALSALEKWQDNVAQNITSSQVTGFRKRTVDFSTDSAGELQTDSKTRLGHDSGMPMLFPKVVTGINFSSGETQPTRRELDVAIQELTQRIPDAPELVRLTGVYHNLLREWSDV